MGRILMRALPRSSTSSQTRPSTACASRTGGNWILRHAGTNVTTTVAVTFNQWSHVMATMPDNSQPHNGVLYVNGVALAVQAENYDTTATVNAPGIDRRSRIPTPTARLSARPTFSAACSTNWKCSSGAVATTT